MLVVMKIEKGTGPSEIKIFLTTSWISMNLINNVKENGFILLSSIIIW